MLQNTPEQNNSYKQKISEGNFLAEISNGVYGFCSDYCKQQFEKDSGRYIAKQS